MNITTYSPALVLLYAFTLIWILMGVEWKSLNKVQRWLVPLAVLVLGVANHLLRNFLGAAIYGKLLLLCMHLPTFLLFLYIAKRGVIKTAFMIMTALVFTTPTVLIGNLMRRVLFVESDGALLLTNLISYILILLLVQYVFRNGFNYLILHGDNKLFLLFSIVPAVFYFYMMAAVNLDFSTLHSFAGFIVRFMPSIEVFVFYFMLPYVYKSIQETQMMKSAQAALQQKLDSSEEQLSLLGENNTQMAVYRHDMRHQFIVLDGLLTSGKMKEAQEFVKTQMADLDSFTPKRFCENETLNLLCSSYDSKANRMNVHLTIDATLPATLSLTDTELCSVVSNGLENALHASLHPDITDKWISFFCTTKQNKILLQVQNPYAGNIILQNGIPTSTQKGHGYGCQSIQTIVHKYGGNCSFEAENGIFTLRILLPLEENFDN